MSNDEVKLDGILREKIIEHKNVATGNFLRKLEILAMEHDMDHFLYNKIRNLIRWENTIALNRTLRDLGFEGTVRLSRGSDAVREDGRSFDRPIS